MDLLIGFATILVVIAAGAGLAHAGVLDARSQRTLGEIAFFVASPALMVITISRVHLEAAAANLVASSVSLAACFAAYAVFARLRWKIGTGPLLIGALSSSYVNAGNLGIAIAAYVVGDITVVVPTLLVQMLFVQPIALIILDRLTGRGEGVPAALRRLVTNPLTLAALLGLVLALTGWHLPAAVVSPLEMLAGAAIPLMLMSYGAALRLSPPLGRAGHNREVMLITVLKLGRHADHRLGRRRGPGSRRPGAAGRRHHRRPAHRAEHLPARHPLPRRRGRRSRDNPRHDPGVAAGGPPGRRPAGLTHRYEEGDLL